MRESNFNSELAAHNIALILTQASIGDIDKENIPISMIKPNFENINMYSKQYSYYYKEFYNAALEHFIRVLEDI